MSSSSETKLFGVSKKKRSPRPRLARTFESRFEAFIRDYVADASNDAYGVPERDTHLADTPGHFTSHTRWSLGQISMLRKARDHSDYQSSTVFGEIYCTLFGRSADSVRARKSIPVTASTPPSSELDCIAEKLLDRMIMENATTIDNNMVRGCFWLHQTLTRFMKTDAIIERWVDDWKAASLPRGAYLRKGEVREWFKRTIATEDGGDDSLDEDYHSGVSEESIRSEFEDLEALENDGTIDKCIGSAVALESPEVDAVSHWGARVGTDPDVTTDEEEDMEVAATEIDPPANNAADASIEAFFAAQPSQPAIQERDQTNAVGWDNSQIDALIDDRTNEADHDELPIHRPSAPVEPRDGTIAQLAETSTLNKVNDLVERCETLEATVTGLKNKPANNLDLASVAKQNASFEQEIRDGMGDMTKLVEGLETLQREMADLKAQCASQFPVIESDASVIRGHLVAHQNAIDSGILDRNALRDLIASQKRIVGENVRELLADTLTHSYSDGTLRRAIAEVLYQSMCDGAPK